MLFPHLKPTKTFLYFIFLTNMAYKALKDPALPGSLSPAFALFSNYLAFTIHITASLPVFFSLKEKKKKEINPFPLTT